MPDTPISRAAVLEILRAPQSWDTFPDMIRRVEALEGCGVRVKALEWFEAGGNFPTQRVWQFEALQWMWIVQNDGGDYVWCEDVSPSWAPASGVRGVFTTLEAAKAAAQADYTARMLAALEPTPPDDVSGGEAFKRGMLRAAEIAIKCAEESKQDPGTGWASHSWLMTVGRIIQAEAAALASAPPAVQECEG